ncbi:FecR family protein [Galbibacter sp.]|uniref:FecR family protein n=1 Tax=Galbibacter sp. TaxID=2918471 RepID=UPI003A8E4063
MNQNEKKELRDRIMTSASAYKNRRRRLFYSISAVAMVVVMLGIGLYQYSSKETSITEFAKSSKDVEVEKASDVQLFLGGHKKLVIQNNNSRIAYQNSGREVNIADTLGNAKEIALQEQNEFNTIIVPYGRRSKIVLSDGTKVWLNSGTKFTYPVVFNGKDREVLLMEGEAIFDVVHDSKHPFKVLSEGQTIEVLGTVFNVSNYPDDKDVKTVLKSGSVQISHKFDSFFESSKKVKITPGTMAVYSKDNTRIETMEVDVENYFSWREGALVFKNNTLKYIMKKLDRYYNVTINFQESAMEEETFSGYLNLKNSIESVLTTLQQASSFNYEIKENGSIVINKTEQME